MTPYLGLLVEHQTEDPLACLHHKIFHRTLHPIDARVNGSRIKVMSRLNIGFCQRSKNEKRQRKLVADSADES